jgi:hypothetical protein
MSVVTATSYGLDAGTAKFSIGGVKRPGCEADHSPPSSAVVNNDGAIPPLPIHLHNIAQSVAQNVLAPNGRMIVDNALGSVYSRWKRSWTNLKQRP